MWLDWWASGVKKKKEVMGLGHVVFRHEAQMERGEQETRREVYKDRGW